MSATMITMSVLATGLASVGALLAYPLASAPGVAEIGAPVRPQRKSWVGRFRKWMSGQRRVAGGGSLGTAFGSWMLPRGGYRGLWLALAGGLLLFLLVTSFLRFPRPGTSREAAAGLR